MENNCENQTTSNVSQYHLDENENQSQNLNLNQYQYHLNENSLLKNECPKKDKDGNCLVPGIYSDSDPIGGS